MAIEPVSDPLLSLDATADLLACSRDTVRRMVARGELPAIRVGRRLLRIRRSDIDRVIRPVTRIDLVSVAGEIG